MGRRLFTIVSGASLVLCITAAAMCLRCHWTTDRCSWATGTDYYSIYSHVHEERIGLYAHMGRIGHALPLRWSTGDPPPSTEPAAPAAARHRFSALGIGYSERLPSSRYVSGGVIYQFSVSYWLLMAISSVLPLLWLWKQCIRRSGVTRACRTCGSDLRAGHDRCPECGTPTNAGSSPQVKDA